MALKNGVRILKLLKSPKIDSKEPIPRLWSLVGRYDNPIPTRFLTPIDCLKIPAQDVPLCFFPTNFSSYPFLFFKYSQKRSNARQTKTTAIKETEKISFLLEIFTLSRD
jgi:hypothetical protein